MKKHIPQSDLASLARRAIGDLTQMQVAEILGLPQPRISEAVNGRGNDANALWLILRLYEHHTDSKTGPAFFEPHYTFPEPVAAWLESLHEPDPK